MRKILLLSALAIGSLSAQEAKKLIFKPTTGITYKYELETISESEMKNPADGQAITIKNNSTLEYTSEVTKEEEGTKFANEITRMKVSATMPGIPPIEFDSDGEDKSGLGAMLGGVIGSKSAITFNDEGEIVKEEAAEADLGAAGFGVGADNLTTAIQSNYKMFPDKAIKIGDTWEMDDEIDMGATGAGGTASVNLVIKLEGYEKVDGNDTAKLSFSGSVSGEIEIGGAAMEVSSNDYQGTIWHDLRLNTPRKSITKSDITISVPKGETSTGGLGSIPAKSTITLNLLSAE